jgi:putative nucleotidyltransferase with HDIG domain
MTLMQKKTKTSFSEAGKSFEKKLLLKKIAETSDLPTPNTNMIKLVKLLRDEDTPLSSIIAAINHDQSLVAKILKLINSGYYGLRKEITNVEQAVGLIGLLKVRQLVYSASVMDMFSGAQQAEWEHAYSCSVLMSNIMSENDLPASTNLPLTALMHDIGKLVLRNFAPRKYKMVEQMLQEDPELQLHEAETKLLQVNHAEAGAHLMRSWEMDENIIAPIENHHSNILMQDNDYILETTLLQIINWVDSKARDLPCPIFPHDNAIADAGLEGIDKLQWVNYQHKILDMIKAEDGVTG